MATVIYDQPKGGGNALDTFGRTLGMIFERKKKEEAQKKLQQELQAALGGIANAPDRETALGILAKAGPIVSQTPQDFALLSKYLDSKHPEVDNTPIKTELYDPVKGEPTSVWIQKDKAGQLANPMFRATLGQGYDKLLPTKPKVREYIDPRTYETMSLTDEGAAMFPGVVSKQAFDAQEKKIADKRQQDQLNLNTRMVEASIDRMGRVASAATGARSGETAHQERVRVQQEKKTAANEVDARLGAGKLSDGTSDLSSLDAPKLSVRNAAVSRAAELVHSGKARDGYEAADKALAEVAGPVTRQKEVERAAAKTKSATVETKMYKGKPTKMRKVLDGSDNQVGWEIAE